MINMQQITIFCLPYAGGNSSIYSHWEKYLPLNISIVPIELPGHGSRSNEPLVDDLKPLIEDLFCRIKTQLSGNYYILGCSMGALLAYELTKRIHASLLPMPAGIIVAAQKAPSILSSPPYLCEQSSDQLKEFLHRIGGVPEVILGNKHLLDYFLPLIRADLSFVEKYHYELYLPLPASIFAFYSPDDVLYKKSDIEAWAHFTSAQFVLNEVRGGHFFIKNHPQQFISHLLACISPHSPSNKTTLNILETQENL